MMPRWMGSVCCARYGPTKDMRDTPLIMLSAWAGEESRVEGMDVGAVDYLVKPFSAREWIARVEANLKMLRLRIDAAKRASYRTAQTARH
jgi:DNA-binding response OmpR family regulator